MILQYKFLIRYRTILEILTRNFTLFLVCSLLALSCTKDDSKETSKDLYLIKPEDLQVLDVTKNSVKLSWSTSEGKSITYYISYRIKSAERYEKEVMIKDLKCELKGLESGTSYVVRLRAKDGDDRYSNYVDVSFSTKVLVSPETPQALSLVETTKNSIKCSWKSSKDKDGYVISYYISCKEKGAKHYTPEVESKYLDYTIKDLKSNTVYYVAVRAKDDDGLYSDYAELEIKTKNLLVPDIPKGLEVVDSTRNLVKLSWSPSIDIDGKIVKYYVSYREKDVRAYHREVETEKANEHTLTGLMVGSEYFVRIRSQDDDSLYSPYAEIKALTSPLLEPSKPLDTQVSDITYTTATLSWKPARDDVEIQSYHIFYKEKNAKDSIKIKTTSLVYDLEYLTQGTTYVVGVCAKDNDNLYGDYAEVEFTTKRTTLLAPGIPKNFKVVDSTQTTVKLSWDSATDSDGFIEAYFISYKADHIGATYTKEVKIDKPLKYDMTGLEENTLYFVRIRAQDNDKKYSNYIDIPVATKSKNPTAPSIPVGLKVISKTKNTATLSWLPSTDVDGSVVSYHISYKEKGMSSYGVEVSVSGLEYILMDLLSGRVSSGMPYLIRVRAKDNNGEYSDYSEEVLFTTTPLSYPSVPQGLRLVSSTKSTVTLTWEPSTDDDGEVYAYYVSYKKRGAMDYGPEIEVMNTSYTLRDLELSVGVGTDYIVRVRSKDDDFLASDHAELSIATQPAKKPSIPGYFKVDSTSKNGIDLSWLSATDLDGSITAYYISCAYKSEGLYKSEIEVKGLSHTFRNLNSGTAYLIRLRAKDDDGIYSDYTEVEVSTRTAPTVPASFKIESITKSSIDLSWLESTDVSGVVKGYYVSYKSRWGDEDYGIEQEATGLSHALRGLESGEDYMIRIRAKNAQNIYSDYAMLTAKTKATPTKPLYPMVSDVTYNSIRLFWLSSTDADGDVTGYYIYHKEEGVSDYQPAILVSPKKLDYTFTGLKPEVKYVFQMRAKDDEDHYSDYTEEISAKTTSIPVTPIPSYLKVLYTTKSEAKLSWRGLPDKVSTYHLSYKEEGSKDYSSEVELLSGTDNDYTLKGLSSNLTEGTNYIFRVRAKSKKNIYSDYVSVILTTKKLVKPEPPSDLQTANISSYRIRVFFSHFSDPDGKITDVYISYKKKGSLDYGPEKELSSAVNTYDIEGLSPLTTYLIRARVKDDDGLYSDYKEIEGTTKVLTFDKVLSEIGVANDIVETPDGGYLLVGVKILEGKDVLILKIDRDGNKVWDKTFGGIKDDEALAVIRDGDDFVLAGYTHSKGAGKSDMWLLKIDKDGNKIWDKTFGGIGYDGASSVIKSGDGGYVLAGYTSKKMDITYFSQYTSFYDLQDKYKTKHREYNYDMWVLKVDGSGGKVWEKKDFRTQDHYALHANALVIPAKGGGYVVGGYHAKVHVAVAQRVKLVKSFKLSSLQIRYDPVSTGIYDYSVQLSSKASFYKFDRSGNEVWSHELVVPHYQVKALAPLRNNYIAVGDYVEYRTPRRLTGDKVFTVKQIDSINTAFKYGLENNPPKSQFWQCKFNDDYDLSYRPTPGIHSRGQSVTQAPENDRAYITLVNSPFLVIRPSGSFMLQKLNGVEGRKIISTTDNGYIMVGTKEGSVWVRKVDRLLQHYK